jgi:hypothetical protein
MECLTIRELELMEASAAITQTGLPYIEVDDMESTLKKAVQLGGKAVNPFT